MIRERTNAGLAAMRVRRRVDDGPKKRDKSKKIAMAQALYDAGQHSIADICQIWGSPATLHRMISLRGRSGSGPAET